MRRRSVNKLFAFRKLAPAALLLLSLAAPGAPAAVPVFNVLDFGAGGDGRVVDTAALQRAIDAAARAGGGARVLAPRGRRFFDRHPGVARRH